MGYYITGDCHAHFDKLIWLARFNKKLGKEDVIILLGDVGLNYFGADKDRENKKNLRIFQIISCVFMEIMRKDLIIYKLTEHKSGVEERYIMSRNIRIYYLQKTEKFMMLMGKKAIAIGGAYSQDKEYRLITGLPWFPDEQLDDKVKSQVENKSADRGMDG